VHNGEITLLAGLITGLVGAGVSWTQLRFIFTEGSGRNDRDRRIIRTYRRVGRAMERASLVLAGLSAVGWVGLGIVALAVRIVG
jgi:hypothetical protein